LKADTITKDYMSDTAIFADVFNYYIYGGEQIIQPEQLIERDSTKITLPYGADGAVVPVQKFRDVQKLYAAMTDGNLGYVLYGIEAQSEIHYAAAVKNNLYDAMEYAGQVEEAARSHRRAMKQADAMQKKPNAGEFLSGFWKEDQLIPSVTVMLYFSPDVWDGPLSLFDMMEVKDSRIFSFLDNYHVRLIAPAQMTDEEIMKFQSSLREVIFFIKYSKDRKNLDRILKTNEKRFREVERRAADVIEAITHTGLKYDESEEVVDMCQAIQEMKIEFERSGEQKGELKKAKETAGKLYEMGLETEKIAQAVGYAVETVKGWLGLK
jgi:hypothetical protein